MHHLISFITNIANLNHNKTIIFLDYIVLLFLNVFNFIDIDVMIYKVMRYCNEHLYYLVCIIELFCIFILLCCIIFGYDKLNQVHSMLNYTMVLVLLNFNMIFWLIINFYLIFITMLSYNKIMHYLDLYGLLI